MGAAELDAILREAMEKKGWLRELEEKLAQAEIEKEEMIFKAEQEKRKAEQERQEKLELERKAEQERLEKEQERQERLELERKAEQEKCKAEQERQERLELERKAEQERQEIVRKLIDIRLPLEDISKATGFSVMEINLIGHNTVCK